MQATTRGITHPSCGPCPSCPLAQRPAAPGRRARPHTQLTVTATFSSSDHPQDAWQRVACGAAAALLSLQAITTPAASLAAGLPPAAAPPLTPAGPTPGALLELPPLPTDFPPLPPLQLPKYQRVVLKSGLRVVLLEDHEIPFVRGTVLMRGGQRASPPDQVGMASIAAAVQRSGGSVAHPAAALDDELEEMAAAIEAGAGPESVSVGFQCLAEDTPRVLELFAEVLATPAVPPDQVEMLRAQALNALAHRNDSPGAIPGRELAKLIYGFESVWAREPTIPQIASITAADVAEWLVQWERPDAAVLGVVGDFKPAEMKRLLEQKLGGWVVGADAGPPPPLPSTPLPDQEALAGRVFLVDRPGATQASVAVGEAGIQMMDPDEQALDVLGGLLNSFGGKLFDQIRSRDGLAYSVGGGWVSAPLDHPGLFIASAETAQPAELLVALRQALGEASQVPPTDQELRRAKEESLNSFVFGFTSNVRQLRRTLSFELFGIPQDYPFTYRTRLSAVTAEDVRAAAERHLHPQQQVTVVVGDGKVLAPLLERALGVQVEALEAS